MLVDGQPMRACLMFAVSAVDARITTVEGLTNADGTLGPVQQAFKDCHALQCGFCTPGFLTTITAGLEDNPDPTEDEARDMIAGNLCRCTGYQNIVKAVGRAAELEARHMTTKLFGTKVPRVEDDRLLRGDGRYLDDLAPDALHAAVLRSPHAHARITGIEVDAVLDVEGVVAVYTYDDLDGPMAEPLPLLIPHPTLTHGRTQYALAKDEVNYVGEAVAFVVAVDRYVAEDALDRIRVTYEPLPAVVGIPAAREATHLVHDDVPGNVGAHMEQHVGDAAAAIEQAPHRLSLDLDIERSACQPMEGRGTVARWDPDQGRLQVWTSTQTATGVRAAVAAKLGLDLRTVDVITPDVGGGFGVKINHPWPEELLVPLAARALGRPVKFVEDRREHFISSAHERGQQHHVEVGFDDEGRLLGLSVRFWHDHGAYTPYGLIVPIITSTQLLGPYKPRNYSVVFDSVYTNTVMVTPYRGAGRPQGVYTMERTMDAIAAFLGKDRADVRSANFIQPDEFPYDHGLVFQDGRPLTYDSGDYPASLAKLKALVGWDEFEQLRSEMAEQGRQVGIGLACYVEGTGVGPYEGAHVHVETSGKVKVATGLTSQGQGHQTVFAQLVADVLGVRFEDVEVVTGDTRRMPYAVGTFASRAAVMSGSAIHKAALRTREKALRIAAEALEADVDDLEIADGVVSVKGAPGSEISLGTVAVLSNPLRYAFDEASKSATQFAVGDPGKPPVAEGEQPGSRGHRLLLARAVDLRQRHARGDRRDRPADRGDHDPQVRRRARLRPPDQPDDRRGTDPRRRRAGRRRRALRADGVRRARPAPERLLHGLPDALRHRGADQHRDRPPGDPLAAQPARHQGRGGGGRDPVGRALRLRDRGRRGLPDHRDADQPERPVRAAGGAGGGGPGKPAFAWFSGCGRAEPTPTTTQMRSRHDERRPDEDQRPEHRRRPGPAGVGRAPRPVRAGAHDPRLRAARGDRRPHLRDDGLGRRGRDQGHVRRHLRALGPPRAGLADHEGPGRRRAGHDRRHGLGQLRRQR